MSILEWLLGDSVKAPEPKDKKEIYELFFEMESKGVFIHQEFLWSFYFESGSQHKLECLMNDLYQLGFTDFNVRGKDESLYMKADVIHEFDEESFYDFYMKTFELGTKNGMFAHGTFDLESKDPKKVIETDPLFPGIKYVVQKPIVDGFQKIEIINKAFLKFKKKKNVPNRIAIKMHFEADQEDGLANEDQELALAVFEIKLKKTLHNYCKVYWYYKSTHNSTRTLGLYTAEKVVAQNVIASFAREYPSVSISHESYTDPDWTHLKEVLE